MGKDKIGTNLNVIHYVEYDAQTLMKFIEHGEQGNNALLELLKGILGKCFTLMFSLNGGAAVACLAFLGNVITKDFTSGNLLLNGYGGHWSGFLLAQEVWY